jgi:hypothetical protein
MIRTNNKKNNLTDFFVDAFLVFLLDHHLLHVVLFGEVDDDLMMEDSKNLMKMMEMVNQYLRMDLFYNLMQDHSDL